MKADCNLSRRLKERERELSHIFFFHFFLPINLLSPMPSIVLAARKTDMNKTGCLPRKTENETYGVPYYVPATVLDTATQVSSFKGRSSRREGSGLNEIPVAPASTWSLENEFMVSLITGSFAEFRNANTESIDILRDLLVQCF